MEAATSAETAYLWKVLIAFATITATLIGIIYYNLKERVQDVEVDVKEKSGEVKALYSELKDLKESLPKNYQHKIDHRRDIDLVNDSVSGAIMRLEASLKEETANRTKSHETIDSKLDTIFNTQQTILIAMERLKK